MARRPLVLGAVAVVTPILLVLAFLLPRAGAQGPLDRYASYRKAHPELFVKMTVRMVGFPVAGEGTLRLRQPDHMLFRMGAGPVQYACLITPAGVLETDVGSRTYDEFPFPGELTPPPGRLSQIPGVAFPNFIFVPDLRRLVPPGTEWKAGGRVQIRGRGADEVFVNLGEGGGEATDPGGRAPMPGPPPVQGVLRASVDDEGRLVRFHQLTEGLEGKRDVTWEFEYGPSPGGEFALEVPAGYMPYALPPDRYPLQIGEAVPLDGWADAATGAPVDLRARLGARPALLALLGADSEPSRRALPSLDRLGKKLKVVIATDATQPAEARRADLRGAVFDPAGTSLNRLAVPMTPMFFLVGSDGKLVKAWMGYDPAQAAALEGEILAAIPGPS